MDSRRKVICSILKDNYSQNSGTIVIKFNLLAHIFIVCEVTNFMVLLLFDIVHITKRL